jgi:hypothetical protein
MLDAAILSVVMLNAVVPPHTIINVIRISVNMLSVVMQSVMGLNVAAPSNLVTYDIFQNLSAAWRQ